MVSLKKTPVEKYQVNGHPVYVKREDLCASNYPYAPPFSKIRGLDVKLQELVDRGFYKVAYVETSVSMAGWGVACLAREYGLRPVIFDPQYVITPKRLRLEPHLQVLLYHREMWKMFDAQIIPIQAGRAKVNYYIARNYVKKDSHMTLLPLGLPLNDTRVETCRVALAESKQRRYSTVVVNVGSGTICSGVVKGFQGSGAVVIGVMGRTGSVKKKKVSILNSAGIYEGGLFEDSRFELIDPGYQYTQAAKGTAPFACHLFYDLKAWKWLEGNIGILKPPILFWNIGSSPYEEGANNGRSQR